MQDRKLNCPKCKINISTMENLHKNSKFKWICNCGKDVSIIKLNQLFAEIKKELNAIGGDY